METSRVLKVDQLARVEGEGALTLTLSGDEVVDVSLRIFEPPRLFEAFLRGRAATEAPDLTARICGICPVAYQMSACYAVERALGVEVPPSIADLRRLLYCGEWIQSHALHVLMLHAPDFLGVDDVVGVSRLHPERVKAGLELKKAGNSLMTLVGGRAIHPINVKVGGFYSVPTRAKMLGIKEELERAKQIALEQLTWVSSFEMPELERPVELVALRDGRRYPFCEGRLVSTAGLDICADEVEEAIVESHVERSTALHAELVGRGPYVTGPLARFVLNEDVLSRSARAAAELVGLDARCRNPFKSILVRSVELIQALDEALAIVSAYAEPPAASVAVPARAGRGAAMTEAPRGMLYHRYETDDSGALLHAKIMPPTSQNQRSIELDLVALGPQLGRLDTAEATRLAERAIRNYDPCISCSTHFLTLRIERLA